MNRDFFVQETDEEYRKAAAENLTSHALRDYRQCPRLYRKKQLGLIADEDTAAFLVGRAAHVICLEGGDVFAERFAVGGPVNPKTNKPYGANTKAFEEWAAEQGRPVLTDAQYDLVTSMALALREHRLAAELLSQGKPEVSVRTEYRGAKCQARIDWLNFERGIVDLKTCDDLTWFESDARRFEYFHQMAFYRALVACYCQIEMSVSIIAVEKKEPFRAGVWQVAPELLDIARDDNEAAIGRLLASRQTDTWPTHYEDWRILKVK